MLLLPFLLYDQSILVDESKAHICIESHDITSSNSVLQHAAKTIED